VKQAQTHRFALRWQEDISAKRKINLRFAKKSLKKSPVSEQAHEIKHFYKQQFQA
jgi:hypothetical protein